MEEIEHLLTSSLPGGITIQGDTNFGKPEWEITCGENILSYSGYIDDYFWEVLVSFAERHGLQNQAQQIFSAAKEMAIEMDKTD